MSYSHSKKMKSHKNKNRNGSKGNELGKGAELLADELSYFKTLSENMKNAQGEEKASLCASFISEFTDKDGPRYVSNQISSRMLEDVLPSASAASLLRISSVLSTDLWSVCTDAFASHVLQSSLVLALRLIQDDYTQHLYDDDGNAIEVPLTEQEKSSLTEFLIKVSRFCCNNLIDFIGDTYASHVLRTLLSVLTGTELGRDCTASKRAQMAHSLDLQHCSLPSSFTDLVTYFAQRLMTVPELPNLILGECASAVYQCALRAFRPSHHSTLCLPLVLHLLNHGLLELPEDLHYGLNTDSAETMPAPKSKIISAFNYNPTARLLEVMIECSSTEMLRSVFQHLEPEMEHLVKHRVANFTVQRVLQAWQDIESFETVSSSVAAAAGAAFDARHTGVLLAWAKACRRLGKQQGTCIKTLMSVLECCSSEEEELNIVPCLLYLCPWPRYAQARSEEGASKGPLAVTLHGSLILQELLQFFKPIKLVKSLLQMSIPELLRLMQDAKGSHVVDAFCTSQHIGPKSWNALVSKIQNEVVTLACSRHGSRSLEALWTVSVPKTKAIMCQHLADNSNKLKASEWGAILYAKFNVRLYSKKDKSDWQQLEQKKAKKRQMLLALKRENQFNGPPSKKQKMNTAGEDVD